MKKIEQEQCEGIVEEVSDGTVSITLLVDSKTHEVVHEVYPLTEELFGKYIPQPMDIVIFHCWRDEDGEVGGEFEFVAHATLNVTNEELLELKRKLEENINGKPFGYNKSP